MKFGVFYNYLENGPGKVAKNLVQGLSEISANFSVNTSCDFDIILQNCDRLNHNLSNCFIGPNICTLPIDNPKVMNYENYKKIIVPSNWVKNLYLKWLPENKILVWPTGINTELFQDTLNFKKTVDCLIYFKRRDYSELEFVKNILNTYNQSFEILQYGNYSESTFLDLTKKCRYAFILDNSESQGIAIQEIMSSNLPLFVWDIEYWIDRGEEYKVFATSVPYWDDVCGIIETKKDFTYDRFKLFLDNINDFNPRSFITKNLSLKDKANELIKNF